MPERRLVNVVSGPVLEEYGRFRVRSRVAHYSDGTQDELFIRGISLTVSKDSDHDEMHVTLLDGREPDLVTVVRSVHQWLRNRDTTMEERRQYLASMSTHDGMRELQADLDARPPSEFEQQRGYRFTASEWLADLHDGLDRDRQLYAQVDDALRELEALNQEDTGSCADSK